MWTTNGNVSVFTTVTNGFETKIQIYPAHDGKFQFICRSVGMASYETLAANSLAEAKAEALTLVTERLKAIVSQLENAQLK
jgi:hypothetical protein